MQHQFEGRAQIIGVASRDTIEQIEAFVADTGVDTFPHAADIDGDVWEFYGIGSQPAFVFINDDGTEIPQDFRLRVTPVTATARFFPFGRYATVQPYAGAGVGFFNWRYSEVGEFIDFNTFDVFRDRFVATGNDVGGVYLAGVRFLAGSRYSAGFGSRQTAPSQVSITTWSPSRPCR